MVRLGGTPPATHGDSPAARPTTSFRGHITANYRIGLYLHSSTRFRYHRKRCLDALISADPLDAAVATAEFEYTRTVATDSPKNYQLW